MSTIRPVLDRLMSQDNVVPTDVSEMTETFRKDWNATMELCLKRAEELELHAKDLRERAEMLLEGINRIPKDILDCVIFDNDSRNIAEDKY